MWRALLFCSLFLFILCKLGPWFCQQIAFQEVCNFCVLPLRLGGSALNKPALGFVKPSRAQSLLRAQSDTLSWDSNSGPHKRPCGTTGITLTCNGNECFAKTWVKRMQQLNPAPYDRSLSVFSSGLNLFTPFTEPR